MTKPSAESIWGLLRPAAQALVAANGKAGKAFRLSPTARASAVSAEDGSSIVIQLNDGISIGRGGPLPIQGRYWDSDGHVVFVTAFADQVGNIYEIEVARVDLQPILDLPRAGRIEFSDLQTGYYRTNRPAGTREE